MLAGAIRPAVINAGLADLQWPDARDQLAFGQVSVANDRVPAFPVYHAAVLPDELSNLGFHGLSQHLPCSLAGQFLQNAAWLLPLQI
jgi:hypothetical protein